MPAASQSEEQLRWSVPALVLDTNVVLDWVLFRDPRIGALSHALEDGSLCWLATDAMLAEARHMLQHPSLARWDAPRDAAIATCRRLARVLPTPPCPAAGWPRCSDPDDQPFIDLAVHERARWLLTHDRAVLKLRGRLARLGVKVMEPQDWTPAA
jgi:predicted nucleic acid-binding protein